MKFKRGKPNDAIVIDEQIIRHHPDSAIRQTITRAELDVAANQLFRG